MDGSPPTKRKIIAAVLLAGVLPWLVSLGAHFFFGDARLVQEPLHECLELVGTCIAMGVAMLLLLRARYEEVPPYLIWVIAALVAMGLVDGVHGIAPFGVAWSWLRHGATLLGGALFGMVWLPLPAVAVRRKQALILIAAAITLAVAMGIWQWSWLLPAPWGPKGYSLPVKAANALGGLGFLASAMFFFRRYFRQSHSEDLVFASHTLLFGTAGLLFGFSEVWAADWWAWHGFRLLAYAIVLAAAYQVVATAYHTSTRHMQELKQANRALNEENAARKQAEAAVQAERERFNHVVDMLPAYVILLAPDYHVPFANRFFEDRFGKSNGQRCYEYLFHRTEPCENCETYKVLKTAAPHRWEWTGPDGRNYDIYDFPFTDVDGSSLIMEVGLDITERKQAEEALWRSEELLNETQRITRVGGWECDVGSRRVIWTDEVYRIHGVSKDYDPSNPEQDIQFYSPDDQGRIGDAFRLAVEHGEPYDLELQLITAQGGRIWVRTMGQVERKEGKVVRVFGNIMNITERKQAEAAVRAERQRFLDVLETLPVIVALFRPDHRVEWVNRAYREALGDNVGKLCYASQFGLDKPCQECQAFTPLKTGQPHNWEWTLPNGRTFDIYNFPFADADGSPLILEMDIDTTERRRAEAALKEANETLEQRVAERTAQLQAVVDNIDEGIVVCDLDGNLLHWNPASLTMHGFTGQDEARRRLPQFTDIFELSTISGEVLPLEQWPLARLLRGESLKDWEVRIRRLQGDWQRVFNYGGTLVRDAQGQPFLAVVTVGDITERKQAEAALRNSELKYRRLHDSIRDALVVVDMDGRIQDCNATYREMLGYTQVELSQVTYSDLTPPKWHAFESKIVAEQILSKGSSDVYEKEYRRKDGTVFPVELRTYLISDDAGRPCQMWAIVRDITERKRADEALKASLAEKEVLLKEIHHRVKNNMQVISSLVALQTDRLPDDAMRSVLQDVTHRVRSMALVHEKLYQSPDMARVEFAEYAQSLLNYLWRAHGTTASGVRLVTDLEPVALSVNAAVPCGLILNELASNALKHAFRGQTSGEVTVSLRGSPEGEVCLRVRDNGMGLPPGLDWRQADSLGLRIVQILAAQLHAAVEMCSGEGTEFRITFGGRKAPEYRQP